MEKLYIWSRNLLELPLSLALNTHKLTFQWVEQIHILKHKEVLSHLSNNSQVMQQIPYKGFLTTCWVEWVDFLASLHSKWTNSSDQEGTISKWFLVNPLIHQEQEIKDKPKLALMHNLEPPILDRLHLKWWEGFLSLFLSDTWVKYPHNMKLRSLIITLLLRM